MPTYDYVCRACGHEFDHFQRMSDGALRKCPHCGELKLKRLMGIGAGIIFRGSGFYETDYKRKSSSNGKARPASATSTPSPSSTSKESESGSKTKSEGGGKSD